MTRINFTNGGFVIHRALGRHISAWYGPDGQLLDAELIDKLDRSQPVKRDGPTWRELQAIGAREPLALPTPEWMVQA